MSESKKVILVTGSNAGIGYELVRLLAKENKHIVYLAYRSANNAKDVLEQLPKELPEVKYVQLDVTDINSVNAAKDIIEKAEGKLDVLVNNAGIAMFDSPQNALTVDLSVIRPAFETNFFGMIQTTQAFLPLLRKSSQPVICNVTTDMASNTWQARPDAHLHLVAYNTSKAAANSYTIALAYELGKEDPKFKVNAVTPGFTTTKLNLNRPGGKTAEDGAKAILPFVLVDKDGPHGKSFGGDGKEFPW